MTGILLIVFVVVGIVIFRAIVSATNDEKRKREHPDAKRFREQQEEVENAKLRERLEYEAKLFLGHFHHRSDVSDVKLPSLRGTFDGINERAAIFLREMQFNIGSAEHWLEKTRLDFIGNAFASFWDSAEQTVFHLANFNENARKVADIADEYSNTIAANKEISAPPFVAGSDVTLIAANRIASDIKSLVRQAQSNFQFAMIFEQRKTNKLLVVGFTSLANAVDDVAASVGYLGSRLSKSIQKLEGNLSVLRESVDDLHTTIQHEAKEKAERDAQALEMLDDIQNRHKP